MIQNAMGAACIQEKDLSIRYERKIKLIIRLFSCSQRRACRVFIRPTKSHFVETIKRFSIVVDVNLS